MSSLIESEKLSWYDRIESPIRPIVKLLRDNGFNTFGSCGHEMWIEMETVNDEDVTRLGELLLMNGYRKWEINYTVYNSPDCYWHKHIRLQIFNGEEK